MEHTQHLIGLAAVVIAILVTAGSLWLVKVILANHHTEKRWRQSMKEQLSKLEESK